MKRIRILKFDVGKPPYYKVIENDGRAFQKEVNGYFQFIIFYSKAEKEFIICCNQRCRINRSVYNKTLVDENFSAIDYIYGNFFVAKSDIFEDDLLSIEDSDYVDVIGMFAETNYFDDPFYFRQRMDAEAEEDYDFFMGDAK